jgi:hypothetical protein
VQEAIAVVLAWGRKTVAAAWRLAEYHRHRAAPRAETSPRGRPAERKAPALLPHGHVSVQAHRRFVPDVLQFLS